MQHAKGTGVGRPLVKTWSTHQAAPWSTSTRMIQADGAAETNLTHWFSDGA